MGNEFFDAGEFEFDLEKSKFIKNIDYLNSIIKDWTNVQLINLDVDNLTINDYNILLTSKSFYDNFKSKYVLIFQTDSIIRR